MVAPPRSLSTRLPLVTVAVCAAALALSLAPPPLQALLQFDRERIAAGELWRLVTCHAVHYSPAHAARDIVGFAILGSLLEHECRPLTRLTLATASVAVPLALWIAEPTLGLYRGLSALDFALLGALCANGFIGRRRARLVAILAVAAALIWIGAQWIAPSSVGTSDITSYTPVASAHLVGLLAGLLVGVLCWSMRERWIVG